VLGLVGTLEALVEKIKDLEDRIARAVRAHPDGEVFLSLFVSHNRVRLRPPLWWPRSETKESATQQTRLWPQLLG
jgi:hypothetical protein